MATTQRIVTGHFEYPGGLPRAAETISYELAPWSYVPGAIVPGHTIEDVTDETGNSATLLWCNAEGMRPTVYRVTLPDGTQGAMILPVGEDPIDLDELFLEAASINWPPATIGDYLEAANETVFAAIGNDSDPALGDTLVGMRHTGTGAVGRTVHDRLDDTWHAADWGASPAALASANVTAINAAIAAVAAAGGGVVELASGTYDLNARLVMLDNVTLKGAGLGTTVLDFQSGTNTGYAASGSVDVACCIAAMGAEPVELPALAGDAELHALTLTFVSDVSGLLTVGDVIRIQNPADYSHSYYRPNYYAGELARVQAVAGAVVTLATRTFAQYRAADVQVHRFSLIHATIRDMTIIGKTRSDIPVPPAVSVIDPAVTYFRYATGLLTENVELTGSNWIHVYVSQCYDAAIGAKVHHLPPAIGYNYGVNVNNSQNIIMLPECQLVTTRHGLSLGGADPNGVVTRNVQIAGMFGGFGGSSTGSVATHANCEYIYFNDPLLQNGLTLSGDHLYGTVRIQTGANTIGIGGSELVGAHIDLTVTIDVKAVPVSVLGSARAIIGLNIQPDFERGGTIRLRGTIDMGGHTGAPMQIYLNGDDALVDCDISLNVLNASPDAASCISSIRAAAGVKGGRVTWHDCQLDEAEIRLDGVGAALASLTNITIRNPNAAGIQVLANSLVQSVYQTRSEIGGVWGDLGITYTDTEPPVEEVGTSQFTLAAANDAIYFGYVTPFKQVDVDFAGTPTTLVNTTPRTLTWQYYNGSAAWDQESAWTALAGISDGTILAGAPFGQDGIVSWTIPGNWAKVRVGNRVKDTRGPNRLYWVRARTSGAMTLAQFGTNEVTTDQPVTEEHFDILGCAISGGRGPGVSINATSQALSTARILNSKLNNNGASPTGGTSEKTSFFASDLLMLEAAGNWVGDTRAPFVAHTEDGLGNVIDPGNEEVQSRLWRVDDITQFYEHDNVNVFPTGLFTVTETNVAYRLTSMESGRRRQAPGAVAPSTGSWLINDIIWNTAVPSAAKNIAFWTCIQSGTFGTLVGVTATTTAAGSTIVVNTASGLSVGQWITITDAGLPTAGTQIQTINGTTLRISTPTPNAVTGQAVSYLSATFMCFGRGRGTTAQRPTLTTGDSGFTYWDVTLSKYINWSGTGWDV